MRILVKAYPQPSSKHEETVCCAGIDEKTREFLRLFPIRYRRLDPENRFERFDQVEMATTRHTPDPRPESYHVEEDSIRVTAKRDLSKESQVKLWAPFVADSLTALHVDQKQTGRSLGIVKPDPGSVSFKVKRLADADDESREMANQVYEQTSLLEDPLQPIPRPDYTFAYRFTSAGKHHTYQIYDWEVQAAYFSCRKRYGNEAMDRLIDMYEHDIPNRNLHLIMGNTKKRPWQFIIIGLLRSPVDPEELDKQTELF